MFNQKRFDELKNKAKLSPAEKAELKVLQKQVSKQQKAVSDNAPSNEFGITKTTAVKPYPIRFTETDHNLLSSMSDNLINHHSDEVQQQLGSLREINKTKLIRAALHALNECSPAEQIAFIKDVKFNMASTRQVHKGADDLITDPVAIAFGKLAALCQQLNNKKLDIWLEHHGHVNQINVRFDVENLEINGECESIKVQRFYCYLNSDDEKNNLKAITVMKNKVIELYTHWQQTGQLPESETGDKMQLLT